MDCKDFWLQIVAPVLSALIGGGIAYFIARSQIKGQAKNEQKNFLRAKQLDLKIELVDSLRGLIVKIVEQAFIVDSVVAEAEKGIRYKLNLNPGNNMTSSAFDILSLEEMVDNYERSLNSLALNMEKALELTNQTLSVEALLRTNLGILSQEQRVLVTGFISEMKNSSSRYITEMLNMVGPWNEYKTNVNDTQKAEKVVGILSIISSEAKKENILYSNFIETLGFSIFEEISTASK